MTRENIKTICAWFCRVCLLLSVGLMTYFVLLPHYNFSHWVPHGFLKQTGFSYTTQLWLDHNLDKAIHLIGAMTLVILLYGARCFSLHSAKQRLIICVLLTACLAIGAEFAQLWINRGFSYIDILYGMFGIILAIILINKTHLGVLLN